MLPKQTLLSVCFSIALFSGAAAQHTHTHTCGHVNAEDRIRAEHPQLAPQMEEARQELEAFTKAFVENQNMRNARADYVIPMVFHVIHMNGPENISDAQIEDAVRILNRDFNGQNEDIADVAPAFAGVVGDASMEFRLARLDPNGNPTNGIDRIVSNKTFVGDDGSKLNPWPRDKYLNIWVVEDISSGAAAYAYLPFTADGFPAIDGIITRNRYVGSFGTSDPDNTRTLTHEIGHFFNLLHPWGFSNNPGLSSNCGDDDLVGDTPNTIGTQFSCNLNQVTCGSQDNVQNFMDYGNCEIMFTQGQVGRMQASANSPIADRNNLWSASNLQATGIDVLIAADFYSRSPVICQFDSVHFYDESRYLPDTWNWTFENGSIANSTDQDPVVFYDQPGAHNVSLSVSQSGANSMSVTKPGFVFVAPAIGDAAPYSEDFETTSALPSDSWYNVENLFDNNYGFVFDATNGYGGGNCVRMNNFGNPGEFDYELHSTSFDLSVYTQATFSFKYAYARRNTSDQDQLFVYVSTDCGETWLPRFSRSGNSLATTTATNSSFVPTGTDDWTTASLPTLSASLLGDNVRFLFLFKSGEGNNLYIDDINIEGTFGDVAQLHAPYDGSSDVTTNVTLTWKPMTADEYEVQIATDAAFSNPNSTIQAFDGLTLGSPGSTWSPPGLSINQTYFWRVRLIRSGTPEAWSETWSFTPSSENPINSTAEQERDYAVMLYPNPADRELQVNLRLEQDADVLIRIFDLAGRSWYQTAPQVIASGNQRITVPTSSLPAGIYIVDTTVGQEHIRHKIVVTH